MGSKQNYKKIAIEKKNFTDSILMKLDHKFEAAEGETLPRSRGREIRLEKQKKEISQLFDDWSQWFEETRRMVDDPNPYVDVRAVFVG